jgi:hypothetical protein
MPSYDVKGQFYLYLDIVLSYLFFYVREFLISRSHSTSLDRFIVHIITKTAVKTEQIIKDIMLCVMYPASQ